MLHKFGFAIALYCLLSGNAHGASLGSQSWDYSNILSRQRDAGLAFEDLPGFTRSVYERDHALIAPESRVWQPFPGWKNALTAHLISPANGASFTMYLADLKEGADISPASRQNDKNLLSRFAFVLDGAVNLTDSTGKTLQELHADDYVFFPAGDQHRLRSSSEAGLVVYEQISDGQGNPALQYGHTNSKPVLPVPGEVFELRKLLPASADYNFNIHIMDFHPGEHLNIKEIHYNQHGLLLLQGKGIYRLADKWYPIQAGDAVWMPPYVIQWYAALGKQDSRYILYKDTTANPALYGSH